MPYRWTRVLVAVLFLSAIALSFSGVFAQEEAGSGGVGGRPAYPREDNERSESIFVHTLNPGETVSDGVNVINNSAVEKTVSVYATDSVVSSGGAFACAQEVDERISVGSWVTLETNSVLLSSTTSELVDFTITVPEDIEVGEYNGCIVMQGDTPASEIEQGIGLSFRTAIRIAILVPGEIVKDLKIIDLDGTVTNDNIVLTPSIENIGNVSVDAEIKTTLKYLNGATYSTAGGQFPVLRGEVGEWNFEHDRPFWGGVFKANVIAEYDENVENYLGEADPSIKPLSYPETWIFVMPTVLAGIIELMALALLVWGIKIFVSRRREKREIRYAWKTYVTKSTDDIRSVAKARGISWRKLAKVNKLKPPYTLGKGKIIKVPKKKTED